MNKCFSWFAILLVLTTGSIAVAQETEPPPPVETSRISDGFFQIRCNGNVGVIASVGDDGTLVVDTGYAATATALKEELTRLGGGPVRFIVNTHGDGDHVGGNAVIGDGAVIISNPEVRRRMSTYYSLPAVGTGGLPNLAVEPIATLFFNDEVIRVLSLPGGHTDGDAIVHFTKNRIACIGDLVLLGTFPNADPARGGDARRLIEVLSKIRAMLPADTTLIAAHGGAFTMSELGAYIEMIQGTVNAVAAEMDAGNTLPEIVENNPLAPWSEWENPDNGLSFENWITEIHASLADSHQQSICAPVTEVLERNGVGAAVARYRHLKSTEAKNWGFAETELNMLGYQLMARERFDDAIAILELNVEAYPEAFNTYDSLGESYMLAGRTDEAITNYERSLELNPGNTNATAMLNRLRSP